MANHQRGIQTVEQAGEILNLVCCSPKSLSLSEIAEAMQLAPGSAYKYLVSLLRTGLLKRNESTLEFEAGPLSLRMGLAKIRHDKLLNQAQSALTNLAAQYQLNVFASVWSAQNGPTVVFYKQAGGFFHIGFRLGIRLSLHRTASGRVFAAYINQNILSEYVQRQEQSALEKFQETDYQNNLEKIRKTKLSYLADIPTPGIQSFAVPVFDHECKFVMCITAFGRSNQMDLKQQETLIQALHQISADLQESSNG